VIHTLRVALVGTDHWHAPIHVKSFLQAGAVIVGGCGGDEVSSKRFTQLASCPMYENLEELVSKAKPDFIMAMAKHHEMPSLARRLFEIGLPFGIEKPLGRDAGEVAPLAELEAKTGLFAAIPFVNRYSLLWEELKKSGNSSISHAHFRIVNGSPSRYEIEGVSWMLDPRLSGGGCLRNLGIHTADAFLYATGNRSYSVRCAAVHNLVHGKPVEEFATALLVSESGAIVTIEAGYSYPSVAPGGDFEWRIATADRYIIDRESTLIVKNREKDAPIEIKKNRNQLERYGEFARDTLRRLTEGLKPASCIEDCYRAMQLIDQVYAAAGLRIP